MIMHTFIQRIASSLMLVLFIWLYLTCKSLYAQIGVGILVSGIVVFELANILSKYQLLICVLISIFGIYFNYVFFCSISIFCFGLIGIFNHISFKSQEVFDCCRFICSAFSICVAFDVASLGAISKLPFSYITKYVINIIIIDVGGYIFGHLLKGPKPFTTLSPGKTISGYIGALSSLLVYNLYFEIMQVLWVFVLFISAIFSDLIYSLFKRGSSIKDYGSILPGHGGALDRLDSILGSWFLLFMIQ